MRTVFTGSPESRAVATCVDGSGGERKSSKSGPSCSGAVDILEAPAASGPPSEARKDSCRPLPDPQLRRDGPPVQLDEARRVARHICREKTNRRCLDLDLLLKDAGTDPDRRGPVGRSHLAMRLGRALGPCALDDTNVVGCLGKLRDSCNT